MGTVRKWLAAHGMSQALLSSLRSRVTSRCENKEKDEVWPQLPRVEKRSPDCPQSLVPGLGSLQVLSPDLIQAQSSFHAQNPRPICRQMPLTSQYPQAQGHTAGTWQSGGLEPSTEAPALRVSSTGMSQREPSLGERRVRQCNQGGCSQGLTTPCVWLSH